MKKKLMHKIMVENIRYFKISLILFVAILIGCSETSTGDEEIKGSEQETFMQENVAFTDARIRSLSEIEYVREIVFTNFSDEDKMQSVLVFMGSTFFDDGSGNDLKENDGVYTTSKKFNHNKEIPYNRNITIKSILSKPITDYNFKHYTELERLIIKDFPNRMSLNTIAVALECKVKFGTGGCYAADWGWCRSCCVRVYDCKVSVTWSW